MREVGRRVEAAVPRVTRSWGPTGRSASSCSCRRRPTSWRPGRRRPQPDRRGRDRRGRRRRRAARPSATGSWSTPTTFARLGPAGPSGGAHPRGRRTSRAAPRPARPVPAWLVEGLADHVGYRGTGVSLRVAAHDLRGRVRAGRVPGALPARRRLRRQRAPSSARPTSRRGRRSSCWCGATARARDVELYRAVGQARDAAGVDARLPRGARHQPGRLHAGLARRPRRAARVSAAPACAAARRPARRSSRPALLLARARAGRGDGAVDAAARRARRRRRPARLHPRRSSPARTPSTQRCGPGVRLAGARAASSPASSG